MNPNKVNSMISSNLIAPSIVVVLFSIFFILYAHTSFVKFRKTEFGLFMLLGMTNWDIARIILFENSLIGFFSLATGLVSGTLFSRLFYFLVLRITDVKGISYAVSYESYLYTIIFFTVIYALAILSSFLISSRYEIINLLKESRKEDKNIINKPFLAVIGIILIGIAFFDIVNNSTADNSIVFSRSILLCFIGIYLLISNIVWFITKIFKSSKKRYIKNILFISNLKYTFGQSKKILFIITLFVMMTIFFSSLSVLFISDSQKFATEYNPYHIAYAEIFDKNKISNELLNSIIKNGETQFDSYKSIGFIYNSRMTLLSDKNLNSNLGSSIHVQKGHLINLFQVVMGDGYVHETKEIKKIDFKTTTGSHEYISQGKITKVFFNNIPILSGRYIILNDSDYQKIKSETIPTDIGYIKLMNFKDWYKTKGIIDKLSSELEKYNKENTKYNKENTKNYYDNINDDIKAFKAVSRIGDYLVSKQAGSFLLFLCSFVGILFFISSGVILHFRLLTEFEREKVKYKKLYKIGITDLEISNIISKELKVLFFLPIILGIIIATVYNYSMPVEVGEEILSIRYSLILGFIYLCLQSLFYFIYKNYYIKKLLSIL